MTATRRKAGTHTVAQGYDLDLREPTVEATPAARVAPDSELSATARLAAAALGAPVGVVWRASTRSLGTSGPYGPADVGPPPGSSAWEQLFSRLSDHTSRPVAIADLGHHAVGAGLHDSDLRGLVAFAGGPLRDATGEVFGWVGVLDTVRRDWTQGDRALLEGLAGLAGPGSTVREVLSARDAAPAGVVTPAPDAASVQDLVRLADHVTQSLTTASDGVAGLVSHASAQDDPVLQRHAGVAERHLEVLRAHATRLRSGLAGHRAAAPGVVLFDLGVVVRTAASEASAALHLVEPSCTIPDVPLSVSGSPAAVKRALVQLLTGILVVAAPEAVTLKLHSQSTASDKLEGTLTAELRVSARGVSLTVAELSRAVAGALRPDSGVVLAGAAAVRMSVAGSEIRFDGPGVRAWTSSTGTTVALRWPVDLG